MSFYKFAMSMDDLTKAQKIGQLIMPRIDFSDPGSLPRARMLVREAYVGGFIIFNGKRNIVADATRELQSLSEIPLLFGCDAERGAGQIVRDMPLFPFTMSLAAANNEELVFEQASHIASQMRECGLNLLFAPVADVNSNPENPIINIRSYGDDPAHVAKMCSAFIRGCQQSGVFACAKHFPGHGRTGVDSHIDLPVLETDINSLQSRDLIPFEKSIEAGVASVMTAHIDFPEISKGGAVTVSKEIISNILRDMMGFNGLIITDSLHMEGIMKLGDELDISKRALGAGCDIILDPLNPLELASNLVDTPNLDIDLDSKVKRMLSIKENLPEEGALYIPSNTDIAAKLGERIARESVCLLRGGVLKSKKAYICIFDLTESGNNISEPFISQLKLGGVSIDFISTDLETDQIPDDTALICLIYTTIGAWKKQSTLTENYRAALSRLESSSLETVLISFGSPYVVRNFNKFKTVLCSFDILAECQRAAADVLLGNIKALGRMPVKLD